MGSVAHVEDDRKELVRDMHWLARLGVLLVCINDGGLVVQSHP